MSQIKHFMSAHESRLDVWRHRGLAARFLGDWRESGMVGVVWKAGGERATGKRRPVNTVRCAGHSTVQSQSPSSLAPLSPAPSSLLPFSLVPSLPALPASCLRLPGPLWPSTRTWPPSTGGS